MLEELLSNSDLMAGGWVVVAILALSSLMWVLIIDRYLFLYRSVRGLTQEAIETWRTRHCENNLINRRLREGLIYGFHDKLSTWLGTIQVITAILPLLGLLGTVTGMIKTFEVMTVFGTGNVRGMADGISQALITTMAGLLTALSGMYFASDLNQRFDQATQRLSEVLRLISDPTQDKQSKGESP